MTYSFNVACTVRNEAMSEQYWRKEQDLCASCPEEQEIQLAVRVRAGQDNELSSEAACPTAAFTS